MNRFFFIGYLLLSTITTQVFAQVKLPAETYLAAAVPDSLKENAESVIRYLKNDHTIRADGKMRVSTRRVVTLLSHKADDQAVIAIPYHKKFNTISDIEVNCYDAGGKLIKKYRRSDFYDRAAIDGISIITDDRVMLLKHEFASYPATIDVSIEQSVNSYIDLSTWYTQAPDIATQEAEYRFAVDPRLGFRYNAIRTNLKPQKTSADGLDVYTWSVKNQKALYDEDSAPRWSAYPHIAFALNSFSFDNRPGDLSSWKSYGQWIASLNKEVSMLSPKREEEIRQMTANIGSEKEKARFLYNYLQKNTRYVSVQLGIGGLKPFPATFVDEKKYGDCKALSNYMYALLRAVGIQSHYALVRAGENEEAADPRFPADPFNHVILCVPFKNDTIWLECTSNTQPFGRLGAFTENRNALLITEDGGKLVNTPASRPGDNRFYAEEHLQLDESGSATASVRIDATGDYRSDYEALRSLSGDDQRTYLIRNWAMKQPGLFELKHLADSAGMKTLAVDLEYDRMWEMASGNKFFYKPALIGIWNARIDVSKPRRSDFYFPHPLHKECVTFIHLPQNFEIDNLPANVDMKFTYGSYVRKYEFDAEKNQVKSVATLIIDRAAVPLSKFGEMQQFLDNVTKANARKLVLRKKA